MSSSPRKRKRATAAQPTTNPSDAVINPLSHTPHTLKQFTLAGLDHDSPLLSDLYPGFPHRPPRPIRRRRHPFTPDDPSNNNNNLTDKSGDEGGDELPGFTTDADDDGPVGGRTTAAEESEVSSSAGSANRRRRGRRNSRKQAEKDRKAVAYHSKVGVLINTIKRALAEGDVELAKRGFGLLVRSRVGGKRVDLRFERLWELGAEIILREGEPPLSKPGESNPSNENAVDGTDEAEGEFNGAFQLELERQQREGGKEEEEGEQETEDAKAEKVSREKDVLLERQQQNLARLKSYYQYLIQNHPFSKQHPNSTGRPLLEFNVAMFSSEMEGIYALHQRGMEKIEEREARHEFSSGDEDEQDDDMMDVIEEEPSNFDDGFGMEVDSEKPPPPPPSSPPLRNKKEVRVNRERDELRREVLKKMRDVAERMDALLETVPYSRDGEFIRLRAMVWLYIADLCVPFDDEKEKKRGRKARDKERQKARRLLEGVRDMGRGMLRQDDEELLRQLGSEDEMSEEEAEGEGGVGGNGEGGGSGGEESEEEETILPMFSSVPV
ncbi:hypothetical protein B0T21DRAFT_334418 [Apiosordaria backusii]|uniref:Uncharacterized protein n=1 Tax=Apiosordaria backusii TaxID=314023 RepID=A0AA40BKI4_9PEZI|nr:hypothetical protein B0T21DRAFT_334418 [Apiosordaria backusii]